VYVIIHKLKSLYLTKSEQEHRREDKQKAATWGRVKTTPPGRVGATKWAKYVRQ